MEGLYHDTTLEDSGASNIEGSDSPEKTSNLSTESMPSKDFANSDFNTALSAEDKINLLSQMVRIRRFEERSLRAYQQGHIGGFCIFTLVKRPLRSDRFLQWDPMIISSPPTGIMDMHSLLA